MNRILILASFFLFLIAETAAADIQTTGEGATRQQAIASAQREAVEQGIGSFVNSETVVVDSQLMNDKILSHSRGYVTGYKILREEKIGDLYRITISAKVDGKSLKDDFDSLAIVRKNAGNPRILVSFSKNAENAAAIRNRDFVNETYSGIVEALSDSQFRVVDRNTSEKLAAQIAAAYDSAGDISRAADFGLRYDAEYTLIYSVTLETKTGSLATTAKLRVKAQLLDNTRALVIASKSVEQSGSGRTLEAIMGKIANDAGRKVAGEIMESIRKNWMDAQQNGYAYTVVINGINDSEELVRFTEMLEKFPLVNDAREVETEGGKASFEAVYRGKRDQLDRDIIRAARELGWGVRKIRAEGGRSIWRKL